LYKRLKLEILRKNKIKVIIKFNNYLKVIKDLKKKYKNSENIFLSNYVSIINIYFRKKVIQEPSYIKYYMMLYLNLLKNLYLFYKYIKDYRIKAYNNILLLTFFNDNMLFYYYGINYRYFISFIIYNIIYIYNLLFLKNLKIYKYNFKHNKILKNIIDLSVSSKWKRWWFYVVKLIENLLKKKNIVNKKK